MDTVLVKFIWVSAEDSGREEGLGALLVEEKFADDEKKDSLGCSHTDDSVP